MTKYQHLTTGAKLECYWFLCEGYKDFEAGLNVCMAASEHDEGGGCLTNAEYYSHAMSATRYLIHQLDPDLGKAFIDGLTQPLDEKRRAQIRWNIHSGEETKPDTTS